MADYKTIDNGFRSKLIPEELENGSGAIPWSGFNSEANILGEGSNINFFGSKIEQLFPMRQESVVDSQQIDDMNKIYNNSRVKNDRHIFSQMINDEEPHHHFSDQIFNSLSKLPSNSIFIQNGSLKASNGGEQNQPNSNNIDFENILNMNFPQQQNYFPFVIEYRRQLPSVAAQEDVPIYVNPKQYERIIKMRIKRAKAGITKGFIPKLERPKEVISTTLLVRLILIDFING